MTEISKDTINALFDKLNRLLKSLSVEEYGLLASVFKIADDIEAGKLKFDLVAFSDEFDKSFAELTPFSTNTAQMILAYAEAAADKDSYLGSIVRKPLTRTQSSTKPAMIVKRPGGE
jgi:hypothetical protein